ncbi:MAG: HEAT repeat domain-containing protein, partial [Promethearchaeota archaeon]
TPVSLTYSTDEFNKIKEDLAKYQNENQRLNNVLLKLDQNNGKQLGDTNYNSVIFNFPKQFQTTLFKRMYNLLDETGKKNIIDMLIQDLKHRNNDVKRVVLKILCEMREEKVYDAFLGLLQDEDWVIRYNGIKALTNFGFESKTFKDLLKKLTTDMDIDVRELAVKVLESMA